MRSGRRFCLNQNSFSMTIVFKSKAAWADKPFGGTLRGNQGTYLFAGNDFADVSAVIQIEDDDGKVVFFAHGDGGGIHDLEAALQDLHVGDLGELGRVLHNHGIGVVDAVDLRGFQDGFCLDIHGAQRGGGVGGEVGVAGASGEDHDAFFFKMTDGAAADEGLRDLIHLDGRLHAGVHALLFKGVLQGKGVQNGGEHAHVIGGNAVHGAGLLGDAPKEIAAANHNGDLHAEGFHVRQFGGYFVNAEGIYAKALVGCQGFPGQLEQDALEDRLRHRV